MQTVINGKLIKDIKDFHATMKKALDLPAYYGENFDALCDFLTTWIETPTEIIWTNFEESKKNLGDFSVEVVRFFDEAQKEIEGFSVDYR